MSESALVLPFALLLLLMAADVSGKTGYVGSKICAQCHSKQSAAQEKTGHALSLSKASSHRLLSSILSEKWLFRPPNYQFRFQVVEKQLRVKAHDGKDVIDIPVDWAFGAGDQAVTFVSRIDRDWYIEHYFTFYSLLGAMGPTAGHQTLQPKKLSEAMGLPYKTADANTGILGCFECHSTGPVSVDPKTGLEPLEQGVRCEACHGPGREHVLARGKAKQSISNPKRLSASALNEFCGRCHRPPSTPGVQIDWNYPWNVRHQPVYLSQSECMQKSGGELSCFTCHQPHEPLQRSSAFYNQRCVSCHSKTSACGIESRSNCIDCHMPRVSPQTGLRFTNHWIGVYGPGSKLKPQAPRTRAAN